MKIILLSLSEGIGELELYTVQEYLTLKAAELTCIPVLKEGSVSDQEFKNTALLLKYKKQKSPIKFSYKVREPTNKGIGFS
ncbi:hypothetical protein BGP75_16885 [Motiliproteus sp. MSK22-1]|nr:hypothetical protein BGP75_16885 [Motiliproteus sp. MSK22-1]